MFVLALFSTVAGGILINLASANFFPEPLPSGIRIRSKVVEGTDKIQRDENVYTFTGNINNTIVVLCDNIVIDGAGYALIGNGSSTGIFLQERTGVTVRNMEIRNFHYGVKLTWGMELTGARNNTISGNTIINNKVGVSLNLFTGSNFVAENNITNNDNGILIGYSQGNVLRNNQLNGNRYNMRIDVRRALQASAFYNDIDSSNTVDGKPIYYWVNERDKTVPLDAGFAALINCMNITVRNLTLSNNGQGILLVSTTNSLITENHLTNNVDGIVLYGPYVSCADNIVTKNVIVGSERESIYEWGDLPNKIYDNTRIPIPEFPSWIILPLFIAATLVVMVLRNRSSEKGLE